MNAITRFTEESDLENLTSLFAEFSDSHRAQFRDDQNALKKYLFDEKLSKCLICFVDGKAVGFLLFTPMLATFKCQPIVFINSVYVTIDFRNSKAFPSLMSALKRYAKKINAAWIDGIVADDNPLKQSLIKLGRHKSKWHYIGKGLSNAQ